MKYLKTYLKLITESQISKILYHGSPQVFENFKNTPTFFSQSFDFAEDYANQKSQDYELDQEPILYKVQLNGNVLDINNSDDYKKLENVLPDRIEYQWNNFGFSDIIDKSDMLLRMTGFYINEPYKPILNCNIGDEIPEPSYPSEKWIVYKIDEDNVYTYSKKEYYYNLNNVFPYEVNYHIKKELRDLYIPIHNYVKNYIKSTTDKNYISEADIKLYSLIFFNEESSKRYSDVYDIKIPEKNLKEFNDLYTILKNEVIKYLINSNWTKTFNRKPVKEKLSDTWRYFENETVHKAIVNLRYDGYIAKEKNVLTYCIFKPIDTVKILEYEIPSGRKFKSWSDWKEYNVYDTYIGKNIPKNKLFKIQRWDIYNLYKKGVSKEKALEELSNRN